MAEAADETASSCRVLNTRKGPRSGPPGPRTKEALRGRRQEAGGGLGVHLRQVRVDSVEVEARGSKRARPVRDHPQARAVILTTVTFLSGLIHMGSSRQRAAGPGREASYELRRGPGRARVRDGQVQDGHHPPGWTSAASTCPPWTGRTPRGDACPWASHRALPNSRSCAAT
jgi:tRNA uridine 5-carboxymethylaminomethyl modification enzyme